MSRAKPAVSSSGRPTALSSGGIRSASPISPSLWESKIDIWGRSCFNEIINVIRCRSGHEHPLRPSNVAHWALISTSGSTTVPSRSRAPLQITWRQLYRQFGLDPDPNPTRALSACRPKLPSPRSTRVEEDQDGLAGFELLDSSGHVDSVSLQIPRSLRLPIKLQPNKLDLPFPILSVGRQQPFCIRLDFPSIPPRP